MRRAAHPLAGSFCACNNFRSFFLLQLRDIQHMCHMLFEQDYETSVSRGFEGGRCRGLVRVAAGSSVNEAAQCARSPSLFFCTRPHGPVFIYMLHAGNYVCAAQLVPNEKGLLCAHYPLDIIVPERERASPKCVRACVRRNVMR